MGSSLAFDQSRPATEAGGIDFYTVPHNINPVKEFIARWYKKVRSRLW
jgi:hypothetical protein